MKIRSILFNILFFCLCVYFLPNCASHKAETVVSKFDVQTQLYGRLLRWREYEAAINLIRYQDESAVEIDVKQYNDLRVVDYEIKSVKLGDDLKTAVVTAEISYYFETQNIIKNLRDTQNWWYEEEAKQWFLDGDLPQF